MKIKQTILGLVSIGLLLSAAVFNAEPASATPASKNGVDCSVLPQNVCDKAKLCELQDTGTWALLLFILTILTVGIGVVAVGLVGWAGYLYTTASDNAQQLTQAKAIIRNVAIGILLYGGMYVLLQYLIPGGIFGSSSSSSGAACREPADIPPPKRPVGNIDSFCYEIPIKSKPKGKLYHRSGSVPYAFENSLDGVRYAEANGYKRIDIDIMTTKDGVIVATHTMSALRPDPVWGGFKDPTGEYKAGTKIRDLTYAEVRRLRHVDGHRIYTLQQIIQEASKTNLTLLIELKTPNTLKPKLPEIAAMLNKAGVRGSIIGLTHHAGQMDALAYARQLGFWTRNITADKWSGPEKDTGLCKRLNS